MSNLPSLWLVLSATLFLLVAGPLALLFGVIYGLLVLCLERLSRGGGG